MTQGPKIAEFEQAVAKRVDAKYAVAFSSGTAALHAACAVAGIGTGDDVITSPITFAASGNCALYTGAKVGFADIDPVTGCMSPKALKSALTSRTKAIIPVDFAGLPCDYDEIIELAKQHNLTVIEDAAHALGAVYRKRPVGQLADMTVFSFHPVKHITTGEGGMVVTDDDRFDTALRAFRSHGINHQPEDMTERVQASDNESLPLARHNPPVKAGWYYEMQSLGYNYRITDIQSALGLSQLTKLDRFLERRRSIAARYNDAFSSTNLLQIPSWPDDRQSAWHLYVIRLRLDLMRKTRRQVYDELRNLGIGVQVHYLPLHLHPYYRQKFGFRRGDFPEAEAFYDSALSLPLFPAMSDSDAERVISSVLEILA